MSDYCDCMCTHCLKQTGEHQACRYYECSDEYLNLIANRGSVSGIQDGNPR